MCSSLVWDPKASNFHSLKHGLGSQNNEISCVGSEPGTSSPTLACVGSRRKGLAYVSLRHVSGLVLEYETMNFHVLTLGLGPNALNFHVRKRGLEPRSIEFSYAHAWFGSLVWGPKTLKFHVSARKQATVKLHRKITP